MKRIQLYMSIDVYIYYRSANTYIHTNRIKYEHIMTYLGRTNAYQKEIMNVPVTSSIIYITVLL